jgi:V8-like Glu-specific endopeptidase
LRCFLILSLILSGLACKSSGSKSHSKAVIGKDQRTRTFIENSRWSPVGVLVSQSTSEREPAYRCTAFLVGPRTIATAAHCLPKDWAKGEFLINPNHETKNHQDQRRVSRIIARGYEFDIRRIGQFQKWRQNKDKDWALLKLESKFLARDLGERYGFFDLHIPSQPQDDLTQLRTAGYPFDKMIDNSLVRIVTVGHCAVVASYPKVQGVFRHSCDAMDGQSGAPILIKDQQGKYTKVIGINVGGIAAQLADSVASSQMNSAVSVHSLIGRVGVINNTR